MVKVFSEVQDRLPEIVKQTEIKTVSKRESSGDRWDGKRDSVDSRW